MAFILEMNNLSRNFGGVKAVNCLSAGVEEGQITALIGPNGAGKTTAFNLITGLIPISGGNILFRGKDITGLPSHRIAALGIARTFQNIRIFPNMNVLENVMVGLHTRSKKGFLSTALTLPGVRKEERFIRDEAMETLNFVGLPQYACHNAASLAFGQQRILEIARALALNPKILLLDEPAAGLNTQETYALGELIHLILNRGVTVFIVEHDMELVMKISHRIIVLNNGQLIACGTPSEVQKNPEVIVAYLGRD
jgi:branched-chain amino acid transport system ATP-binding protein